MLLALQLTDTTTPLRDGAGFPNAQSGRDLGRSKGGPIQEVRKSTNAYLPIITATDWSSALNDADEDQAGGGDWWTVMIPATTRGAGVTFPQDASEDTLIALFAGHVSTETTRLYLHLAPVELGAKIRSATAGLDAHLDQLIQQHLRRAAADER